MKQGMKRMITLCLVVLMMACMIGEKNVAKAAVDYSNLAIDLPLSGMWSGDYWVTDTDKEDYYRIIIPSDGKITLKFMSYLNGLRWDLYTSDWSENLASEGRIYGTDIAPKTEEYGFALSAGTYYIKVNSWNAGRYKMYVGFTGYSATDAGANSYDSPLGLGIDTQVTGAITKTDHEDWYRLNVPTTGNYTVKLTAYMHLYYKLYNWDLSKEIQSTSTGYGKESEPDTCTWDYTLSAGTYYIKISNSYDTGKYLLSWSALTPENCTHDYKSSYVSATYVNRGYTLYTCSKCGHSYRGNYTNKLMLGQGSIAYLTAGRQKVVVGYWGVSNADGFQIRYSRNSKFKKSTKIVKVKSGYTGKRTLKKLAGKKRYYVQIRAYKKVGGKTVYGKWSVKKSVKVK